MREIEVIIRKAAPCDASVCVQGENGTGKELVARAIHLSSPRRDRPFVTVDCPTISPGLIESHLFGHVRGSFTGATADRPGVFAQGHTGTVLNVRQLKNSIEQALVLADGDVLDLPHFASVLREEPPGRPGPVPMGLHLQNLERWYILETLRCTNGHRTRAARQLGISLRGLQYRLRRYADVSAPGAQPDAMTTVAAPRASCSEGGQGSGQGPEGDGA